ncbi:MAG: HDIG domain-containing protein [Candidatus Dadabacteria bacterium]|nr:MAG: HDIG domain-containing protein [Candidatus Dadabacteria bacterium]
MTTPAPIAPPPDLRPEHPLLSRIYRIVRIPPHLEQSAWLPPVLMSLIALLWALMLASGGDIDPDAFVVGEIAPRTVRSPAELVIEDPEATEQARQAAADAVLPIVDDVRDMAASQKDALAQVFVLLRQSDAPTPALRTQIEELLGSPLSESDFAELYAARNDLQFEAVLSEAIDLLTETRVAAEPDRWTALYPRGVEIRREVDGEETLEQLAPDDYRTILNVDEARRFLEDQLFNRHPDLTYSQRRLIQKLLPLLVRPSLLPNPVETRQRQQAAAEGVKPVYFRLKSGEVVVRSGERVSAVQAKQLQGLHRQTSREADLLGWLMRLALLLGATFLLIPYTHSGGSWRRMNHPQDLVFLLLSSTVVVGLIQIGRIVGEPVVQTMPDLPRETLLLALPYSTLALLVRLFYRPRTAFRIAVLFAFALTLFLQPPLLILPYTLLPAALGIRVLRHSRQRSQFSRTGFMVGITQVGVWWAWALLDGSSSFAEMAQASLFAFGGGMIATVLTVALMPFCESVGRYVSEVRLLELAQDDQPLLRWLHMNAPGTFNHSVTLARMAESAAEAIGADGLLVRVGAYYHDLGKGYWPTYFVENQRGHNPHDTLKPHLSARIIIAHVTQGAELARKAGIPTEVIDFILQHHGTSRVEYFYRKASEDDPERLLDETQYRYPGPKPQTKETAVVMLADVCESALRTLENPTEERIAEFVDRLVEKVYTEGQLDDAPLTFRDLHTVKKTFTHMLAGMYHQRIDYPLGLKPGESTDSGREASAKAG